MGYKNRRPGEICSMGGWPIRQRGNGLSTWRDTESNHVLRLCAFAEGISTGFPCVPADKAEDEEAPERKAKGGRVHQQASCKWHGMVGNYLPQKK